MIRVENMVPEVYVDQSRDFQLLCRLLNIGLNGCKFNANIIQYLNYPEQCPSQYLPLLADKLGFSYSTTIYDDELRKILKSFRTLLKYKGSYRGIVDSIKLFMNLKHVYFNYQIEISDNSVQIYIEDYYVDVSVLKEILKYIIPSGFSVEYYFVHYTYAETTVTATNILTGLIINSINNTSKAVNNNTYIKNKSTSQVSASNILDNFNTMQVIGQADYTPYGTTGNEKGRYLSESGGDN